MTDTVRYPSGYEGRVRVAFDALMQLQDLDEERALIYAKCVLHAVDHIPERVR